MERSQNRGSHAPHQAPYNEQVNTGRAGGVIMEHIVEEKDTLRDIARKYKVSLEEIMAANQETVREPADMVKPGMRLRIPRSMG